MTRQTGTTGATETTGTTETTETTETKKRTGTKATAGRASPERARLTATLRELKARTGLSLARLEERTPYSKSSWDRYLNGKTLPPRQAVLELCRFAREPVGRCLALWEIAESESSGRAREEGRTATAITTEADAAKAPTTDTDTGKVTATATATDAASDTASGAALAGQAVRTGTATAVLAAVCAIATGVVALTLFVLPHPGAGQQPFPSPPAPGLTPLCRGGACEGRNPMTLHCGSHPATLVSHQTAAGVGVELRYSQECGTSWARMWGTRVGDRIEVAAAGHTHSARIQNGVDAESYVYTPMVATLPGTAVMACFRPAGGQRECVDGRVSAPPTRGHPQ